MKDSNPSEVRPHLHVLYEYGEDLRPYSSSFLRLLRPLSHPIVQAQLESSFALDYDNEPADLVIIDRLWRNDVTLPMVQELVNKIRLKGCRVVYALDDDYFDLENFEHGRPVNEILPIVTFLLRQADAVLVTTPALRQCLLEYNQHIFVLPNQLDERLLVYRQPSPVSQQSDRKPLIIGYMGTFTHDDDLEIVLPALRTINQRYPRKVQFQVVGVIRDEQTKKQLEGLPIRFIFPNLEEHEYPLFMLWFTGHVGWDIAISPLKQTRFNDCKSDIKFLDYSAIGAAGIFSQSPAYTSTVHHRQDGWLAENTPEAWEEALETMLHQTELRLEIASNAFRNLYARRILAHRAADWVDFCKSVRSL